MNNGRVHAVDMRKAVTLRARSLGLLVKARAFGMTQCYHQRLLFPALVPFPMRHPDRSRFLQAEGGIWRGSYWFVPTLKFPWRLILGRHAGHAPGLAAFARHGNPRPGPLAEGAGAIRWA